MTLVFEKLRKQYGNNVAIDDVTATFAPGLIHGIIGPNGAGKSTLINMTAGSYELTSGRILLNGREISGLKKYQIANAGVARTYQNIRLFDQMSVLENLEVCFYGEDAGRVWQEVVWPPYAKRRTAERHAACRDILRLFELSSWSNEDAGSLPYGRQRMLEIARALVRNPSVLLLDEPAAGLNHAETAELTAKLRSLRTSERIMIIVEHDMDMVMSLCDRILVMHHGKLLFQGTPAEAQASADVQQAYLGTSNDNDAIKSAAEDRRLKLGVRSRRGPV